MMFTVMLMKGMAMRLKVLVVLKDHENGFGENLTEVSGHGSGAFSVY